MEMEINKLQFDGIFQGKENEICITPPIYKKRESHGSRFTLDIEKEITKQMEIQLEIKKLELEIKKLIIKNTK